MEQASFQQVLLNQLQIPIKLLTTYKTLGLNEQDVMIVLQIQRYLQERNDFPTPSELCSSTTVNEQECADILRKLIQKKLLTIKQLKDDKNLLSEAYSLNPLWEEIFATDKQEVKKEEEPLEGTIFILFEQEFGRPLSPFEIERISAWLDEDKIAPALIKAGLRESVLMGKLNFTYIDRILRDWKKKGIHSVEQAREATKNFRKRQVKKQYKPKERDTSFYYNWLEDED